MLRAGVLENLKFLFLLLLQTLHTTFCPHLGENEGADRYGGVDLLRKETNSELLTINSRCRRRADPPRKHGGGALTTDGVADGFEGIDNSLLESNEYLQALVAGYRGSAKPGRKSGKQSLRRNHGRRRGHGKEPSGVKGAKRATVQNLLDDPFSMRGFRDHHHHRHTDTTDVGGQRRKRKKKGGRKGGDGRKKPPDAHKHRQEGNGDNSTSNDLVVPSLSGASSGPLASVDPAKKAKANEIANLVIQMAIQMAMSPGCQQCGIDFLEKAMLGPFAPFSGVLSPRNTRLVKDAIDLFRNGGAGMLLNAGKGIVKMVPVKGVANTATSVGGKVVQGGHVVKKILPFG